jgi:signal peptidase I
MADDNIQRPPETLAPPPPARTDQVTAAPPVAAPAPPGEAVAGERSEAEQLLRWGAGLVLVMAAGWGFIALVGGLVYKLNYSLDLKAAALIAAVFSLGFFILLERNLWLSRFMGLRTEANPSRLKEAFFLWLLGVPGLLWRSTEGRDAAPATDQKTQSDVSNTREVIETVVFVVVLVLLLKSFVAEAFVIPTGSMATTLYGYQKIVDCPKCGYEFPVNCSQEVDPQDGHDREVVQACVCPNCREQIALAKQVEERDPRTGQLQLVWRPLDKYDSRTGDRVLVGKFLFDLPWTAPEKHRLNVVVFKYPMEPQKGYTPINYIKRLIGLPGETIAISYGKIYVLSPDKGLRYDDSSVPELERWKYRNMHVNEKPSLDRWNAGQFEILRKPPEVVMAQRRIVYDNDHPASDLKDFPRWHDEADGKAWVPDDKHGFKRAASADLAWLRYHHVIAREGRSRPELITDFMGYNSYQPQGGQQTQHWAGDLMLEADVTIDKAEGELVFELSRSVERFRAVFNLATGDCELQQIEHPDAKKSVEDSPIKQKATKPTDLKKPGTYHVRFANVDNRLLLWVDRALPFGDEGFAYTPAKERAPTEANDLQPASVGVKGAGATVSKLQLWRDTYYTRMVAVGNNAEDADPHNIDFADPKTWGQLEGLEPLTLYVQPGHYLCLGDNSPHSSDGRAWGLVPDRLMLGRALVVYWRFDRAGPIR